MTALRGFEDNADAEVMAMPLARLPARALLMALHHFLYVTQHATLFGLPERPGVAATSVARLGYALPVLVQCDEAFEGTAAEALAAFSAADPTGDQFRELLSYMHFSELMPEAHKRYYTVTVEPKGFRLIHRDAAFAEAQVRDILLSELALVFPLPSDRKLEPVMHDILDGLPNINFELLIPLLGRKMERILFALAEPNLITPEGMKRVFGFGYSGFYRIRAALYAYAEFSHETSMILGATSHRDNGGNGISSETLEWISVEHDTQAFVELIAKLSAMSPANVERFLSFFSIDFRHTPARHNGGDGLFPPFARFEKTIIFSPILVQNFLHLRNAIFAFSLMDENAYAAHVSHDVEPVLIRQASELLRRSHPWALYPGKRYPGGEIDLIVAGEEGGVLLVQAKGPLPPQGARLTERLAGRIREGIGQVEKFRALPTMAQEELVSRAIGRKVAHADIRHGLLARSCFGAAEVFDPAFDIARITLPLLSLALGEMRKSGEPADIDALLLRLQAIELRYNVDAVPSWEEGAMPLARS